MKNRLFSLFFLILSLESFSQTKYYYNYYLGIYGNYWVSIDKDSAEYYSLIDKDTVTYGEIVFYYKTGEVFAKDFYENQRLSVSKHYYKNGQKKYILTKTYNAQALDVSNDLMKVYNLSSSLKMKNSWDSLGEKIIKNGSGYFVDYYPNGKKMKEGEYFNGSSTGTWKGYYENGNLMYQGYYSSSHKWTYEYILSSKGDTLVKQGKGKFVISYPNGKPSYLGEYSDGHLVDQIKAYYPNGQLRYIANFNNGMYNGKYESFYSDGSIKSTGNYVNNGKKGEWTWYDNQGKVIKYKNFQFLNYTFNDL